MTEIEQAAIQLRALYDEMASLELEYYSEHIAYILSLLDKGQGLEAT